MSTILVVVHLCLSIALIGLILIQHGKGADAGAAFGSGASATVFGARGSANFLSRATGFLALAFFITSLALAWSAMNLARDSGLMVDEAAVSPVVAEEKVELSDVPVLPQGNTADTDIPAAPVATQPESDVPSVPSVPEATDESTESTQE